MQPEEPQKPQPGAVYNPSPDSAPVPEPAPAEPTPPPIPAAELHAQPESASVVPTDASVAESQTLEPMPAPRDPAATQPAALAPVSESAEPAETPILSWQASEYLHHDKKAGWYLVLFVIVAVLIAIAAFTHQWLTIGVFVVMAGALAVYANKAPRVLNYSLGEQGIMIEDKLYPYNSFRSFGVIQDVAWHMIDLEPLRRFMPRLSILFEDANRDQIVAILSERIQRHDRQPDMVERAARYLRF